MSESAEYDEYRDIADLYDYVAPYMERQDVAFYVDAAGAAKGPVLEIGCGTGRILIPTARTGVEIVGLDLSQHMLSVCRQRLEDEPQEVRARVRLVQGDMRHFDLAQTFDLITIPFRPFQHLYTVEDQIACLSNIRRHLRPEGRFILEIFNPSLEALVRDNIGEEFGEEPEVTLPDGRRLTRRHKIVARDRFRQIIDIELIYTVRHPDGREERQIHATQMRYLFRYEAEHLLARCGFAVDHLYADFDKSPFGSKDPGELIFVARKTTGKA